MRFSVFRLVLVLLVSFGFASGCRTPKGDTVAQKRSFALQMEREALADLYRERPEARTHVEKAPGYAVFSNVGSKILLLATGSGFGVATDRNGKRTYMKMVEAGGGLGLGIKSYKAVYVFNSREAFEAMIGGRWQVGGDADIGAKYGGKGADASAALTTDQLTKPVTVYQFTDAGISLSAVATGTRFYPDAELN